MFTYHYLQPEGMWGVFEGKNFVAIFMTPEEAHNYCEAHNKLSWTAEEILKREG